MKKRIFIYIDATFQIAFTGGELLRHVLYLDAEKVVVIGTPSTALEENIASFRKFRVPVEVKETQSLAEYEEQRVNKNVICLYCRP